MIKVTTKGSYKNTLDSLGKLLNGDHFSELSAHASAGAAALSAATPAETGQTARSWHGGVFKKDKKIGVAWYNTNVIDGLPIAILLDVGHGTGTGGWVPGRHYIDSAINPIMDKIEADVWKKVQG